MGIPKFFRWISERYPSLSQVIRENEVPDFDNLYLDMNGIIHSCSHPFDDDVHFRLPEDRIVQDIFAYIECLFSIIKPRKVFFMAVDGVAPRAKMNQQRSRRFRSAKDAVDRERQAQLRGEKLPEEPRFDSNCITPGTDFMVRLQKHLEYFVAYKVSTDELWKNIRVVLSGHETPGEGEHKIMDFIRCERSQQDYDPYTRHCLYGLDADLIMLGMCSHEPYFSLLREEIQFSRRQSKNAATRVNPSAITFHLLHLTLLRDYLDHEFSVLKDKLPYAYDLESIIDDWILMSFLCGNDFIPHLPHFHIGKHALATLYKVYIEVALQNDGYLNEKGQLNLKRFQKFLVKLSEVDVENFNEVNADLKYFDSRRTRFKPSHKNNDSKNYDSLAKAFASNESPDTKDRNLLISSDSVSDKDESSSNLEALSSCEDEDDEDDLLAEEFLSHKRDYYMTKMHYEEVNREVLKEQAYCYIKAIQWNLHYYYDGCASWSWFYPHHYAPYISDVKSFQDIDLTFEIGEPFKPYEQLLGVLPAESRQFLPQAYQRLMVDENSPLRDFFPDKFELDLDGKQHSWEAVVVIPFIDENKLLEATKSCESQLSEKDKLKNKHGPHLVITYTPERQTPFPSTLPGHLPDIQINHAKITPVSQEAYRLPRDKIKKGLLDGIDLNIYVPGFPTFRTLAHTARLERAKTRVFEMATSSPSFIVSIIHRPIVDMEKILAEYLNSQVYINWPHLSPAKVTKICDGKCIHIFKNGISCEKMLNEQEIREYNNHRHIIKDTQFSRKGIDVGDDHLLLYVQTLVGHKYIVQPKGDVVLEEQWSELETPVLFQSTLKEVNLKRKATSRNKTLKDLFPVAAKCFILNANYYGDLAEVIEVQKSKIKVKIFRVAEPDLKEVRARMLDLVNQEYMTNYCMAQRLSIDPHLLSRLTGSLMVTLAGGEKVNIGLNLKFNSRREEVPGFSKKRDDIWLFTRKALKLMEEYNEKYPLLFKNLSQCIERDFFSPYEIFNGDDAEEKVIEVAQWLKKLPHQSLRRQKFDAECLDECVVKLIEDLLNSHNLLSEEYEPIELQLSPSQIYTPSTNEGLCPPDPEAKFNLFDRVVNVKPGLPVPLGAKGIVIGLSKMRKEDQDPIVDVVFDEPFPGGLQINCSQNRGYRLHPSHLINISFKKRRGGYGVKEDFEMLPIQPRTEFRDKRVRQRNFEPRKLINLSPNSRYPNKGHYSHPNGFCYPQPGHNMPASRNDFHVRNDTIQKINHSPKSLFQTPEDSRRGQRTDFESMWKQMKISDNQTEKQASFTGKHMTADELIATAKGYQQANQDELKDWCMQKFRGSLTRSGSNRESYSQKVEKVSEVKSSALPMNICQSDEVLEGIQGLKACSLKDTNPSIENENHIPPPPVPWLNTGLQKDQREQHNQPQARYSVEQEANHARGGQKIRPHFRPSRVNYGHDNHVRFPMMLQVRPRQAPPFFNQNIEKAESIRPGNDQVHPNVQTLFSQQKKFQDEQQKILQQRQQVPSTFPSQCYPRDQCANVSPTSESKTFTKFVPVQVARSQQAQERKRTEEGGQVAKREEKKVPSQEVPSKVQELPTKMPLTNPQIKGRAKMKKPRLAVNFSNWAEPKNP